MLACLLAWTKTCILPGSGSYFKAIPIYISPKWEPTLNCFPCLVHVPSRGRPLTCPMTEQRQPSSRKPWPKQKQTLGATNRTLKMLSKTMPRLQQQQLNSWHMLQLSEMN